MRLYFMRHAESEANRKNLLAGQLDFPLSEEGQRQSREVADAFLRDRPIDAIISSPLLRARATALPF
ncbi:MAG TPA: histidine phosphatase family protein, partial [Rectinemataceae bacterium]|nr:histidine phosphatase family protein [Rectinemataceae bacterium]